MLVSDLHERICQHVLASVKSGQITQTALAELIGMKQAHISNFLLGRRGLSIATMDAILNKLGITVEQLVAVAEQPQARKESAPTIESVPLIQLEAAMNPTFSNGEIFGQLGFTTLLLRQLKADCPEKRKPWVRFIAVRADNALSAAMNPRVENGSVLLIDRHSCSLARWKGETNLYLVRKGEALMVRRVELQSTQLCLRPDNSEYPLDFISIDRKNPLVSCIVGRVAHIATET